MLTFHLRAIISIQNDGRFLPAFVTSDSSYCPNESAAMHFQSNERCTYIFFWNGCEPTTDLKKLPASTSRLSSPNSLPQSHHRSCSLSDFLPCVFGSVRAPTAQDFVRNSRRGMNFELKLGRTGRLVDDLNVLKGQNGDAHHNLRRLGGFLLRVAR